MILLMTTAPPANGPWYLGRRLPPLGLAYIAAALEEGGFPVQIFDNYLLKKPIDEFKLLIEDSKPEIIGITCGSTTYQRTIETAKAVKEVLPNCKVVVGGWHPSYLPDSMLKHPEIDYVVVGEGEKAMKELATCITEGEEQIAVKIPGVACRHNGKTIKNPPRFISNLEEIPLPARHLLPMHLYDRTNESLNTEPVDTMIVSRGCPYNCAICETRKLWGNKCRSFSPKRVVEEIHHLTGKYNTKGIYFVNDNFTIRKKETMETCELIHEEKLDVEWLCGTRPDLISRELLRKMKKAGCQTIWFGAESGAPRILEKINRGISLNQLADGIKLCREEGIQVACSFMLGIPGETVEDMETTFKVAKKLNTDWCHFNIFVAYPDSILYEEILKEHLYSHKEDFLLYVKTQDFDYKLLLDIQRRFHKEYNRSPRRIAQKIRREGVLEALKSTLELLRSNVKNALD